MNEFYIFLYFIAALIILYKIYGFLSYDSSDFGNKRFQKRNRSNNGISLFSFFDEFFKKKEEFGKYDFSLISKGNIFTKTELNFFHELNSYIKDSEYFLFTKIRLVDLVNLKNAEYKKYMTIFNKLSKKHVDFIISDKYGNIKVLIELDDKYHYKKKAKDNDEFKNELFSYLDIPLVRFYAGRSYDFGRLKERLD